MEKIAVNTIDDLDGILRNNTCWANGKNYKIDDLHSTGANSRWLYENIWGIYLTDASHAWMALWMAVTDRIKIKKRDITYVRPRSDSIGRIAVFAEGREGLFVDEAYLYFFRPRQCREIDLRKIQDNKLQKLLELGFVEKEIRKNGRLQKNYFPPDSKPCIVRVDSWQIALVNCQKIRPDIELVVKNNLILELSSRVSFSEGPSTENYIID